MIGVCKRGCIQEIKRKINPSAAIAYRTRGNGKSEPSNEAKIPSKKKHFKEAQITNGQQTSQCTSTNDIFKCW
jgi:hypothetical protein